MEPLPGDAKNCPGRSRNPPAPTSLDPLESSVELPVPAWLSHKLSPVQTKLQRFMHAGWYQYRAKVWRSLCRTNQSDSRLCAFHNCGAAQHIEESDETPPRHRILTVMCHDRFCTPCARRRAFKIQECVKMHIKGRRCRFMTLTLKGDKKAKLSDTIDRLYTGFRYLRSHPIWDGVDGGAAMLELKYNDKNHHWHPHLHILVEGRFLPQAELSDAWRSITKDSHIVDIRDARDDGAASYVAKYATKPLSTSYCHIPELLDECIEAIKGRRMILTFGTWYGTRLTEIEGEDLMDDEDFGVKWSMVCDVSHAIDQAIAGNDHYEKILRSAPGGYERLVAHMATGP